MLIVTVVHIRETGAELGHVGADQRIGHQVDVVGDDHQIAYPKRRIHAAAGVRYEQVADPEQLEHPHGERHLLHGVTFVIVEPPLHGHYAAPFEQTENQFSLMSLDRRNGKIGNLLIVDRIFLIDTVGEIAQSGTENNAYFRLEVFDACLNEGRSLFNSL